MSTGRCAAVLLLLTVLVGCTSPDQEPTGAVSLTVGGTTADMTFRLPADMGRLDYLRVVPGGGFAGLFDPAEKTGPLSDARDLAVVDADGSLRRSAPAPGGWRMGPFDSDGGVVVIRQDRTVSSPTCPAAEDCIEWMLLAGDLADLVFRPVAKSAQAASQFDAPVPVLAGGKAVLRRAGPGGQATLEAVDLSSGQRESLAQGALGDLATSDGQSVFYSIRNAGIFSTPLVQQDARRRTAMQADEAFAVSELTDPGPQRLAWSSTETDAAGMRSASIMVKDLLPVDPPANTVLRRGGVFALGWIDSTHLWVWSEAGLEEVRLDMQGDPTLVTFEPDAAANVDALGGRGLYATLGPQREQTIHLVTR